MKRWQILSEIVILSVNNNFQLRTSTIRRICIQNVLLFDSVIPITNEYYINISDEYEFILGADELCIMLLFTVTYNNISCQ